MFTEPVSDTFTEITLRIPGLTIAARRSNEGAAHRVLAVHGWLDNANSFVPLVPLLPDIDLVAIDLPGHGHSSHLSAGAHYHFIDILSWVQAVADALGWQTYHLLGHSLGGCIAPFVAVGSPHSVSSLIMLEATGPLTETADQLPDRLRRSSEDQRSSARYKTRVFQSVKDATDARLYATTMSRAAAQLIVERNLEAVEGGFTWRYDQRHRVTSALYQTEEQVLSVLQAVSCPVLTVTAKDGYQSTRAQTQPRLAQLQQLTQAVVEGNHHMHMDDPIPTAEHIRAFWSS